MKKLFVGGILVGLVAGVYCALKDRKKEDVSSQLEEDNSKLSPENEEPKVINNTDAVKEMYEAKENSGQAIYERHTEAESIMADAFKKIMKNVDPIVDDQEIVDNVIDTKNVKIIQELDSLSDELDELLK